MEMCLRKVTELMILIYAGWAAMFIRSVVIFGF